MGSSAPEIVRDLDPVISSVEKTFASSRVAAERPQHSVSIGRPFALGVHHVTRSEYGVFVRETGYSTGGVCTFFSKPKYHHEDGGAWNHTGLPQTDDDPVVCVSWQDAQAYIAWLNSKVRDGFPAAMGGPYRLPSESEWEYAARADTSTARWWGDQIGINNANCDGCGTQWDKRGTAPVGSFQPNPFGLYDMIGNAWEWIDDCWNRTYEDAPSDGTAWTSGDCGLRVIRGGSWTNVPWILRSASRSRVDLMSRTNYIGFRVAKDMKYAE